MGVEPTIRPAKDRIAGFEGRGDHRTPFASGESIAGEEKEISEEGMARRGGSHREKPVLLGGVGGFNRSALRADQGGDEVVESGAGAHFIVGMRRMYADFPVG